MDAFCGSPFWNWNLTWYSDDPDLTPCFEKTVLIWIPCTFLWLCSFIDIYFFSTSNSPPTPLTKLHLFKCFSNFSVLMLEIAHILLFVFDEKSEIAPVLIYTSIIKTSTFVLALILLTCDRIKGYRSSGIQFLFWLLFSISESLILRTTVRSGSENQLFFVTRSVYCSFVYLLFLLNCFADNGKSVFRQGHTLLEETDEGIPYPELNASFLSRITFYWVGDILQLGYKRPLKFTDLWNLRPQDRTENTSSLFLKHYRKLFLKNESGNKKEGNSQENPIGWFSALVIPLFKSFWLQYLVIFCIGTFGNLIGIIAPSILSFLIDFVTNGPDENIWKGYFFAVLMCLLSMISALAMHQYLYLLWVVAYRNRACLNCAIYRKALLITTNARKGSSVGEIVNLMSVDADKVLFYTVWLFEFLTCIGQVVFATYILHQQLEIAAYAGYLLLLFLIPINLIVMRNVQTLQRAQMKKKDERVKMMNEILSGVKIIKFYAWEHSFMELVAKIRSVEISLLTKKAILLTINSFIFRMAPFLLSLTCFTTYILIDRKNTLDAKKAFVSLAMFNVLRKPLTNLFQTITQGVDCLVSLKRINNFMNSPEKDPSAVTRGIDPTSDENDSSVVKIESGDFAWDGDVRVLKNINVKIKKGSLVAIVGAVGCGKSSILEALLGEMKKVRGRVNVVGTVAYVSQLPYIQNATVEKNITFGVPFEFQKYENIIDCCALRPDLEILPGKDQTEIGEKGINLSGGQKQRVALARAAYYNADVFLLDDPLSSVDANVGKHIFENLIGPEGLLKDKTRVFVTNGISYLPYVDQIIVLNDGQISEFGTYTDLLEKKGVFSDFLVQYGTKNGTEDSEGNKSGDARVENEHIDTGHKEETDKLIEDEKMEVGNIKSAVIKNYVKRVGWLSCVAVILSFMLFQGFSIGGNLWLARWSKGNSTETENFEKGQDLFLGVYGVLVFIQGVFLFGASCCIYFGALDAAKQLHNNMLFRILRAPMWFFDTTPLGRIVNRFGADVQTLDQDVPSTALDTLLCLFQILAILFVVCFNTPVFLIVVAVIIPIFVAIQRYYTAASRQIFRLNSVARSPIFSHFSETLNGVTTIRAYGAQERFIEECEKRIDNLQKTLIALSTSRRWLGMRLQVIGFFYILFTALSAVTARNTLSASTLGLSITYALQIAPNLMYMTVFFTFLETQIVSAERIMEYTEVDQEDEWKKSREKCPEDDWPQKGAISFRNYQTRYREGTNLVLNDVSCDIKPGEKVGVVGRTGAGKSSITLGLFRILEAAGGSIIIDGEDISKLGLHDIRGRLTIIPQDPVLFSGSLRFNLDPFNYCDGKELWTALEHSHLKTFVQELPAGLDHEISEGGGNLSTGQRQLVCLARAILRKCKILILDEATAAVDLETDCLIQNTIRKQFKDCTVITIAHRLNTIMDSDRIIVLAQGEIREFDSPSNLLANPNSLFYEMADSAGLV